eukprot:CAMPEP_0113869584 /NCGR_PEP_ID=MMETSP0780_2-20120614/1616_1 /TAXON_ID=652834 /ORGANISM="Palpitomonas bilix" /LENGTH=469 /DNA_ID=CAMNT_0000854775 /DNA_START=148 /DNA_END=1557 /DNA_ORIENTATION=- /assembly_acc=CAM_ASM_000599
MELDLSASICRHLEEQNGDTETSFEKKTEIFLPKSVAFRCRNRDQKLKTVWMAETEFLCLLSAFAFFQSIRDNREGVCFPLARVADVCQSLLGSFSNEVLRNRLKRANIGQGISKLLFRLPGSQKFVVVKEEEGLLYSDVSRLKANLSEKVWKNSAPYFGVRLAKIIMEQFSRNYNDSSSWAAKQVEALSELDVTLAKRYKGKLQVAFDKLEAAAKSCTSVSNPISEVPVVRLTQLVESMLLLKAETIKWEIELASSSKSPLRCAKSPVRTQDEMHGEGLAASTAALGKRKGEHEGARSLNSGVKRAKTDKALKVPGEHAPSPPLLLPVGGIPRSFQASKSMPELRPPPLLPPALCLPASQEEEKKGETPTSPATVTPPTVSGGFSFVNDSPNREASAAACLRLAMARRYMSMFLPQHAPFIAALRQRAGRREAGAQMPFLQHPLQLPFPPSPSYLMQSDQLSRGGKSA